MSRAMKDSGIPWMGEIPQDWSLCRIKNKFNIVSGSGFKVDIQGDECGEIPICKASDINNAGQWLVGSNNYLSKNDVLSEGFSIIPMRSILFPKIGEAMKKNRRAINTIECCLDNNCQALVCKQINNIYSYYLLDSIDMSWYDNGGTIPCVNNQKLRTESIPIPDINDQRAIADFLDVKCAEVDELIALQGKMIDELKVYKQSVITEAVTKGLNPDAPLKDSGIEWIGQIPKHWKIKRVKDICSSNSSTLSDNTKDDYEFSYVDIGSVNFENGIISSEVFRFKNAPSRARRIAKLNDIVVSTVRTYLRAIDIVDTEEKANYVYSTGFAILSPQKNNLSKFIIHICRSEYFTFQVSLLSNGINYPSINSTNMNCISVFMPPIEEQQQIADYLDTKCADIDEMTSIKQQKIEQLKEYKKSIIYEYVTGKKQVNIE